MKRSKNGHLLFKPLVRLFTEKYKIYSYNMSYVVGDFVYQLNEPDRTATVTGYNGISGDVFIPSVVEANTNGIMYIYTVVSIEANVFENKTTLTSITIPNSVTSIGDSAFDSCTNLTSATIGDGVVTIGKYAFQKSGLTSIMIPNSVTSIGDSAFDSCTNLTSATIEDGDNEVIIGLSTFQKSGLTSITIPKSVISIGSSAFNSCTSLTDVTIEDGDNEVIIGLSTFQKSGLTSITIPKSVISIGSSAFNSCTSLTDVTIEDGNNEVIIGTSAFRSSGLKTLTIPNSVTSIRDYAFYGCTSLTDVTIEDGDNEVIIGIYVFAALETTYQIYSNELTSITIPKSVTSIGNYAFNHCENLTTVTIYQGVVTIGDYAFQSTGLKTLTIPNSVTKIGSGAFTFCQNLTSVNIIDGGTVSIQSSAFANSGLTSITIPKSVTSISSGAFYGCARLTSVTIEDEGALIIYGNAFKNTGLTSIIIPNSVTSISSGAFQTVKYAYIQGDDTNYTTPFGTSTTVYYDETSNVIKTYPQKSLFKKDYTVKDGNDVRISSLFDVNNNSLSTTLTSIDEGDELLIDFPGYTFVGETVLSPDSGTYTLTIALDNIIFVNLPVVVSEPIVLSSQLGMSKNTYTINTKTEFKILKKLIERNPNKLFPIKRIIDTLFTSLSREKYQKITTTYGLYSTNLNLDELADLGQNTLIVLPTRLITITVGDKSLTSNGTDTFVSGERLAPGDSFITKFKNRDFNITLVANGSSAITIEKIETSPICFPAGTPILTNQGYIPIDKITTQTLHNKPIQLTKTISTDKYLVCFEKDSLEKNVPFQRTIISKDHMVYYKDFSLKAKDMIPYFDGVYKIKYKGEVLYNVLLDIHGKMKVNNMTCETLDPKHKMAKLYNRTTKEREDMIVVWKEEKKERTQMKFK
jgi:hypothetical protein